jgi:hypothetical protein
VTAEIFSGGVITVEHLIMILFGAVVGLLVVHRIDRITAALARIEKLLAEKESE